MTYATKQDIIDLYGEDTLFMADRDDDAVVDDAPVTAALTSASNEIDAYVGARHALPLAANPPQLIQPCVDIAVYRLANSAAALTDEHRTRYEDAVRFLTKLAEGVVDLVLPADPDVAEGFEQPSPIVTSGPERIFSREETRDL